MSATITTCFRTIVYRKIADTEAGYVVCESFDFSDCLDAIAGAVGQVESFLGGPVSGILSVKVEEQVVMFRGEASEEKINREANEDEWEPAGEDEWDYAARILKHPVAMNLATA